MAYRKIIGFGDSSFVVSLPKEWVVGNGLKKGDNVLITEEDNAIKINPTVISQSNGKTVINLDFNGDLKKLKSQLIHSYIDSYSTINILGNDLFSYTKEITTIVNKLIALEMVQCGQKKIILQDFLNIRDFSVYDTIRRIDRIVLSMAEDVRAFLDGKEADVNNILASKELDVTRLSNLIFKILKKCFNTSDRAILKLDFNDILYFWEINLFIEKIGDQLKLIPKAISHDPDKRFLVLFEKAMAVYSDAMKSNFTKDSSLAVEIVTKKRHLYEEVEDIIGQLPSQKGYGRAAERIKNIIDSSGNISKTLLRLKLEYPKT